MKVVQILPALNAGGVEKGTLEIAQALVAAGHFSVVISGGGAMVEALESQGSTHIQLPVGAKKLRSLLLVRHLRSILETLAPDIIHVRSRFPAWLTYQAWKNMQHRARLVTTVHGHYSVNRYSAIMCRGERVIAVSDFIAQYIRKNYPQTPTERVVRIHRGVDTLAFHPDYRPDDQWLQEWRSAMPQVKGKRILLLPGRVSRRKGHTAFIHLLAALCNTRDDVVGIIAGGADKDKRGYDAELRRLVSSLGLDDNIIFSGHRDDLRQLMAISDIVFCLSQKPEAFGRTMVEALSLGRAVVALDHGGATEILQQMFPQGLVPIDDNKAPADESLLKRVLTLLEAPAKPLANKDFTLAACCNATLALYQELADGG